MYLLPGSGRSKGLRETSTTDTGLENLYFCILIRLKAGDPAGYLYSLFSWIQLQQQPSYATQYFTFTRPDCPTTTEIRTTTPGVSISFGPYLNNTLSPIENFVLITITLLCYGTGRPVPDLTFTNKSHIVHKAQRFVHRVKTLPGDPAPTLEHADMRNTVDDNVCAVSVIDSHSNKGLKAQHLALDGRRCVVRDCNIIGPAIPFKNGATLGFAQFPNKGIKNCSHNDTGIKQRKKRSSTRDGVCTRTCRP